MLNHSEEPRPMGIRKPEDLETGRDVIEYLTDALDVTATQLAGLLGVSARTFTNWSSIHAATGKGKFLRLLLLRGIVDEALKAGLNSHNILGLLNRPIQEDAKGRALLYFIWQSQDHSLISVIARRLIRDVTANGETIAPAQAVKKQASVKENFRQLFGPINDEALKKAASANPSLVCQMIDEGELSTQALSAAAEALGYTLNSELLDRLIQLLGHSNAYVREGTVSALGSFLYHGIEEEKIRSALNYDEPSKAVRESIHEALELGQ